MAKVDSVSEIKTLTSEILTKGNLKATISALLNAKLSISKDGKELYNTIKFHGNSAIEDLQLIDEWFTTDRKSKESDQVDFAHKATTAAVTELDKFLEGLSENSDVKRKLANRGENQVDLFREIEINLQ